MDELLARRTNIPIVLVEDGRSVTCPSHSGTSIELGKAWVSRQSPAFLA